MIGQFVQPGRKTALAGLALCLALGLITLTNAQENAAVDLSIAQTDIWAYQNQDGATFIAAQVHNHGNEAARADVTFYDGDPEAGGKPIPRNPTEIEVPANGAATETLPWALDPGIHTVFVRVDPANAVPETDETNNAARRQIAFAAGHFVHENMQTDDISMPFEDDPAVLGAWTVVSVVDRIEDFAPTGSDAAQPPAPGTAVSTVAFLPQGALVAAVYGWSSGPLRWTKGYVLNIGDRTANRYTLKEFGNLPALFVEYKNADSILRHEAPKCYVLRRGGLMPGIPAMGGMPAMPAMPGMGGMGGMPVHHAAADRYGEAMATVAARDYAEDVTRIREAWAALGPPSATRESCANRLNVLGLALKCFSSKSPSARSPILDSRPGHLMFAVGGNPFALPPAFLEILASALTCPAAPDQPAERITDDHHFVYLGYALRTDEDVASFADIYRSTVARGQWDHTEAIPRAGNGPFLQLREGVERFFITDINDPAAAYRLQSEIPVLIEWPGHHDEPGGNVLYMDGHVAFVPYPGPWPMTEKTIGILRELSALKGSVPPPQSQVPSVAPEGPPAAAEAPADAPAEAPTEAPAAKAGPKQLRITMMSEGGGAGIDLRVPLDALRTAKGLVSLLPPSALESLTKSLQQQGIPFDPGNLSDDTMKAVVEFLANVDLSIVNGKSRVRIYSE